MNRLHGLVLNPARARWILRIQPLPGVDQQLAIILELAQQLLVDRLIKCSVGASPAAFQFRLLDPLLEYLFCAGNLEEKVGPSGTRGSSSIDSSQQKRSPAALRGC